MVKRYVALAWYHDRSGLLAAYGPYATEEDANAAIGELQQMGVYSHERWDVVACWTVRGE